MLDTIFFTICSGNGFCMLPQRLDSQVGGIQHLPTTAEHKPAWEFGKSVQRTLAEIERILLFKLLSLSSVRVASQCTDAFIISRSLRSKPLQQDLLQMLIKSISFLSIAAVSISKTLHNYFSWGSQVEAKIAVPLYPYLLIIRQAVLSHSQMEEMEM